MVTVVIVINLLISLICLLVAKQVWKLRKKLAKAADGIFSAERKTYKALHGAPPKIYKGQQGISKLHQKYDRLELQRQKLQKVLGLVNMVQKVWQGTLSMGGNKKREARRQKAKY